MTIGETIRQYRRQNDMTQAQLARQVGVSVQAISKWETGAGMPDISQVVPLARALHVTTDTLLDYADREREWEQRWKETLRRWGDDPEKLLEVALGALEDCPRSKAFLFRAAVDYERIARETEDPDLKQVRLNQAANYLRRLLEEDPENESKEMLVRIYVTMGREEEALRLAYECKDKNLALKYCLKGDDLRRHRQKLTDRRLQSLLTELLQRDRELLDPAVRPEPPDLGVLETAERILYAIFPDGNYQHYAGSLFAIFQAQADAYIRQGDLDAAAGVLHKLFDLAKAQDAEERRQFTSPIFDLLSGPPMQWVPSAMWNFLYYVKECCPALEAREDIAQLIREAEALSGAGPTNNI